MSSDGKTCDRCNPTNQEMQRAVSELKGVLGLLGIAPTGLGTTASYFPASRHVVLDS